MGEVRSSSKSPAGYTDSIAVHLRPLSQGRCGMGVCSKLYFGKQSRGSRREVREWQKVLNHIQVTVQLGVGREHRTRCQ